MGEFDERREIKYLQGLVRLVELVFNPTNSFSREDFLNIASSMGYEPSKEYRHIGLHPLHSLVASYSTIKHRIPFEKDMVKGITQLGIYFYAYLQHYVKTGQNQIKVKNLDTIPPLSQNMIDVIYRELRNFYIKSSIHRLKGKDLPRNSRLAQYCVDIEARFSRDFDSMSSKSRFDYFEKYMKILIRYFRRYATDSISVPISSQESPATTKKPPLTRTQVRSWNSPLRYRKKHQPQTK